MKTLEKKHIVLSILLVVAALLSVALLSYAYYTNEGFGFPLDDPWIHLQFAKNLQEYGSFSYYKDEAVTSGSTAPLYTILLALGFFVTGNEMILSYVLGILALLAAAAYFYRLAETLFPENPVLAVAGTVLFILEPRMHWAALSGMETTLFVFLLIATAYYWLSRNPFMTGTFSGLLLWTRPEAVIFVGALVADFLVARVLRDKHVKQEPEVRGWLVRGLGMFALSAAAYALFNYALSGSLLPNTYAAKLTYYSGGGRNYWQQVLRFLSDGHLVVFSFLAAGGTIAALVKVIRRSPTSLLVPLLFSAGMILAYAMKLPYLYQNGRYLMPILPFVLLLGLEGTRQLLNFLARTTTIGEQRGKMVATLVCGYLVVHFLAATWEARVSYKDSCRYITDRQVRTALWIRENLPQDAIVATHDVGAIAFYSGRRIVDMVGLISPEMIQNIGRLDRLREFLISKGVTHLALLRNWFEVVNVNPLFQTNEQTPEIMEVFEFDPEEVHFTSSDVGYLTDAGWQYFLYGNLPQARMMVEQAARLDPRSSRAHHHLGWILMMMGEFDRAERELDAALELHPTYWNARLGLAQIALRRNHTTEAVSRLNKLIKEEPAMFAAYEVLARVYSQQGDTAGARRVLNELYRRRDSAQGTLKPSGGFNR